MLTSEFGILGSPIDARTPFGRLEGDYEDFAAHVVSLSVQL